MNNKFDFGDKVKNIINGITGIVMAYSFYSTGCIHYGIARQELDEDGDSREWKWYDETNLKLIKKGAVKLGSYNPITKKLERNGGPVPNPPQR